VRGFVDLAVAILTEQRFDLRVEELDHELAFDHGLHDALLEDFEVL